MPIYKKINKNFFKNWSSDMAYVLGFFAADGYITVNKRGGQFWCIDITDEILVKKIKVIIESDHKISKRIGRENAKDSYRLQIGSIEMCNDLRQLGFNERKTKNLAIPNVPKAYFSDFVRGYFDGDGNVWSGLIHKDRINPQKSISVSFVSCSLNFLQSFKSKLGENNIIGGSLVNGDGNYFRLNYSINNSLKLYYFMYNRLVSSDNSLLLKRKRIVFEKFIKMRL